MKRVLALSMTGLLAACQTPGYDYLARTAPNFPQALDYTDVVTGRFDGPAGDIAARAFEGLIAATELEGRPWFVVLDPAQPQGIYEGNVHVTGYRGEVRYERENQCVEYDAPFDCERRAVVEKECRKEIVDISVDLRLIDTATRRTVFTSGRSGTSEREDCFETAEYKGSDQTTGQHGPTIHQTFSPYDAPYGMILDAVPAAVASFRTDIAPYIASFRAEIVTRALVGEEAGDPRFEAAVKATKRGEFNSACAQWQELADAYPNAPGIQHNLGACAEARGDLAIAHARYARAAELVRAFGLLRDKDTKVVFDALGRVSKGRRDDILINQVQDLGGS
ncbi:MAG: tetratricopeptide repeat protein [Hyphomonas sp.]